MKAIFSFLLLFLFSTNNVNCQELSYKQKIFRVVYYHGDQEIEKYELEEILSTNQRAFTHYQRSKRSRIFGMIVSAATLGAFATHFYVRYFSYGDKYSTWILPYIGSNYTFYFSFRYKYELDKALLIFNECGGSKIRM